MFDFKNNFWGNVIGVLAFVLVVFYAFSVFAQEQELPIPQERPVECPVAYDLVESGAKEHGFRLMRKLDRENLDFFLDLKVFDVDYFEGTTRAELWIHPSRNVVALFDEKGCYSGFIIVTTKTVATIENLLEGI